MNNSMSSDLDLDRVRSLLEAQLGLLDGLLADTWRKMLGDTDLGAVGSVADVKPRDVSQMFQACSAYATTALAVAAYRPSPQTGER